MKITEITPTIRKDKEKIRLAPYVRVSSDSEDQLHSFATQIQYYSDYVKTHPEYELVDIYADEGLTGTEMNNRDELNRLLRDCKNGKIDRVIVKAISRLARNTEELLITIRMLKEFGVSVYFEEQDIDTDKLNMEMIVTFPGMAAQQESEAISGNLRWSYKKRMESGEFNCCRAAFGYKLVNNKLEVNEEEAEIVRRIYEMYLNGYGTQSIANIFNKEKIPKRYGKDCWHYKTIRYILSNERYIGDSLLQKSYMTSTLPFKKKINHGEKTQYYVENSHPAIISKEHFKEVQTLLKNRNNFKSKSHEDLIMGRIKCSECGRAFRRQTVNDKSYWICSGSSLGKTTCKNKRIREDMIYDAFINMVYKLKNYRQKVISTLIKNLEELKYLTSRNQDKICQIDKEIADLCAKNLIITRLHNNGILNTIDFTTQASDINSSITKLRAERRKSISDESDELIYDLKELDEMLEQYQLSEVFDERLFDQIIDKIIVKDSTYITFKLIGQLELTEQINEKGRCGSKCK